jgi:hypothetical protein
MKTKHRADRAIAARSHDPQWRQFSRCENSAAYQRAE